MFFIGLPNIRIGDTINCRINHVPAQVTWREADTLVIEPDDARIIITSVQDGPQGAIRFTCGDRGKTRADYGIANDDSGYMVYEKG